MLPDMCLHGEFCVVMSWCALIWGLVFIRFVSFRVANVVPGSFFPVLCCGCGDQPCFGGWSGALAFLHFFALACLSKLVFIVSSVKGLLKFKHSSQLALLSPVLLWILVPLSSIPCPLLRMRSLVSDFIFRSTGSPLCGCVFLWKVSLLRCVFRLGVVA